MRKHGVKSLIEELDLFVPQRDRHQIVEARASNVIASAINVMRLIQESFGDDEAEELQRRLVNAIKNRDPEKFNRKIREFKRTEERRDDK